MTRFFDDKLALGISSIIGAGIAYNSYKLLQRVLQDVPPRKWRKVGQISDLWVFPVKSCGPLVVDEFNCEQLGPKFGNFRDRFFTISHGASGESISGSKLSKVVLITPKVNGSVMTLSAEGMEELKIDIEQLYATKNFTTVKVGLDTAECIDCGVEAAQWLSRFILGENEGLRLNFYPSNEPKPIVNDRKYLFEQADQKDSGTFHDEASYLIMNQGSFDEFNTRIESKVGALQYRPNFLVKGAPAWDEDTWQWMKIGDVVFKNVQPCIRCAFTTVNPLTGLRDPAMESLKTLKTYRTFEKVAKSPVFGIHLGIRGKEGKVKLGDDVHVNA